MRHNGDKLRDMKGHYHSCVLSAILRAGHSGSFLAKQIQSFQQAVGHCNEEFYPNTSTILQLLLTLPVPWGGGGVHNKVLYGEAPPRGPTPYPFIYHFGRKSTPFIYLLLKKRYPFHIPILGSLVLVLM